MEAVWIRPGRIEDTDAAVRLLLELPGGLREVLGDEAIALRVARAVFAARRSALRFDRALVAGSNEGVAGLMVSMTGREWSRRRVPTGLAMVRAAGTRFAWQILRRGRLEDQLSPRVPFDALHIVALAVAPEARSGGIGSALLMRAIADAGAVGLGRITLDVHRDNEGAIRLYERHGFEPISEHRRPARAGLHAAMSVRMERRVERA